MASRLQIAKADIVAELDRLPRRILTRPEISSILSERRGFWRLAKNTTSADFIDFLTKFSKLRPIDLHSENYSSVTRFAWGEVSKFEAALSLKRNAYLSHGTAIFLHNLTNEVPRTIYVNQEQSPKPASGSKLTQEGIKRAFANNQRTSNFIFTYEDLQIVVIAGKNTGNLEVGELPGPDGEKLPATKLERTLIDCAVRPGYAGGVHHVVEAYAAAKGLFSINVLLTTLKLLDYTYPYHQAIGFYMQRAGYEESRYRRLKELGTSFDFYLSHGLKTPAYDAEWRLFYPEGL